MPDIIHLLPDSVANQIAAGEVIQRPASVLKELVENAIDAEADSIQIILKDAGRTLIRVIDDGKGMSETDARMAFERHATSKIMQASDLFSLHTMGFRGEALPSIASVAQVELRTRRREDELGTLIKLAGSDVELQEPVSCAFGSAFDVKNLFFHINTSRYLIASIITPDKKSSRFSQISPSKKPLYVPRQMPSRQARTKWAKTGAGAVMRSSSASICSSTAIHCSNSRRI